MDYEEALAYREELLDQRQRNLSKRRSNIIARFIAALGGLLLLVYGGLMVVGVLPKVSESDLVVSVLLVFYLLDRAERAHERLEGEHDELKAEGERLAELWQQAGGDE